MAEYQTGIYRLFVAWVFLSFGSLISGCTDTLTLDPLKDRSSGEVRLAFSVHVEGFEEDVGTTNVRLIKLRNHSARVDLLQDAVEPHGVKLTFEPEEPYLDGEILYLGGPVDGTVTTLSQRLTAGHFAAPHADLHDWTVSCPKVYSSSGGGVGAYTSAQTQCAAGWNGLTRLKSKFEEVGLTAPTYISGVCAESDWMALSQAFGFTTVGGIVGWCARTITAAVLATHGTEYSGVHDGTSCTNPANCHDQMPYGWEGKYRPWRTADITDWLGSESTAAFTIVPAIGDPRCQYELESGEEEGAGACAYTDEDVDAYFRRLNEAVSAASDGNDRVLVLTLSVGGAISSGDVSRYSTWAERVKTGYIDSGKATWGSMVEAGAAAVGE